MLRMSLVLARALLAASFGALLSGCGATRLPARAAPPTVTEDENTIVAVVVELKLRAHEEQLPDGSVHLFSVVAFDVVRPKGWRTLILAQVNGHPRIDSRPLLLGNVVTFVLPKNWRGGELSFSELRSLAFY